MHQEQQETLDIFQSEGGDINLLTDKVEEKDVCIYWYFGSHGLREGAIDFYKNHISSNICKGATPCLVDLTA